jgi:predicted porin
MDLDTGTVTQGGVMWGRRAYAGLSGDFGTVAAGRQSDVEMNMVRAKKVIGTFRSRSVACNGSKTRRS